MIKTFSFGILLGILLAAGLMVLVPAVDQYREASIISVQANGGNTEAFHANLPDDRILLGAPGADTLLPAGLEWPADGRLDGSRTELFKIRNRDDVVVGVASRIAGEAGGDRSVEWTIHLPARGSVYASLAATADQAGSRGGRMRAGTREFAGMSGDVRERFVADPAAEASEGRMEVTTMLVGAHGDAQ